jgi:hypothetical protein
MNNPINFKEIYKTYFYLFCFTISTFIINYFLVQKYVPKLELEHWSYSIFKLYSIFFVLSLVIMSLLLFVKSKNLDNVGYTYLIATSIKMGIAYFLLRPILKTASNEISSEKMNFFIVFISFLAIETLLTIRILNNKQ